MKRKRIITLALIAGLTLSIQGCGSSHDVSEDYETYEHENENENEYEDETEYDDEMDSEMDSEIDSDTEQYESQDDAIEGLILADAKTESKAIKEITILSLDISSGLHHEISKFYFDSEMWHPKRGGYYATHSEYFSDDYQKMVWTRDLQGMSHAGWIDTEGNFFDVTGELDLHPNGDFSKKQDYYACGFYEGYFVFKLREDNEYQVDQYHTFCVPIDNIVPEAIEDRDPFSFFPERSNSIYDDVATDWVGDSIFITNTYDANSVLYNTESGEKTEYIPESSRMNWNGVLSPDGTQIAFMSLDPRVGNTDIYTVSLSGEEPNKVPTTLSLCFNVGEDWCLGETQKGYPNCIMLIDWK